jgi:hypothetical protein
VPPGISWDIGLGSFRVADTVPPGIPWDIGLGSFRVAQVFATFAFGKKPSGADDSIVMMAADSFAIRCARCTVRVARCILY